MDQERHDLAAAGNVVALRLLGAHLALDDRISLPPDGTGLAVSER